MSEFKGTKGKWYINGDGKCRSSVESKEFYVKTICTVNTLISVEETHGNALLISKAPKMLHALEYLINETNFQSHFPTTAIEIKELIKEATEG